MAGGATRRLRTAAARSLGVLGLELSARRRNVERKLAKARTERDAARRTAAGAEESAGALARRAEVLTEQLEVMRASADLAAGRDRADLRYVVVVTYGRSGSTLLQGILSSTPGVMIRGENGGLLLDLYRLHTTATGHRDRLARPAPLPPEHPWWGIDGYRDATAFRSFRTLMLETVLRPEPGARTVGFKEIDWIREDMPGALRGVLAFTRNVFPGVRFVLNTRNLDDVARSKWWAGKPDALVRLRAMEQEYVDALAVFGDDVYRVHYDDYVADPMVLRGLFTWLDLDFDEERVRAVMAVRHSY